MIGDLEAVEATFSPEGGRPRYFWKPFCAVSGIVLVILVLFAAGFLVLY